MNKQVIVAMSGGVDSAVAAALMCEQGYKVRAVYMRNWSDQTASPECPWARDLADAERAAVRLGIDLELWDYEAEYKRDVVDYLVDGYKHGFTPNPDVICNEKIKFGIFAREAFERGADYIATGHYAQIRRDDKNPNSAALFRARDEHKDQTYFLWRVDGDVFARTLFPIGTIKDKAQVRRMARSRGLELATKPDSTGICFIGPLNFQQFLLRYIESKPGEIIEFESGKLLGYHQGAFLFTLGQRRGLDLGGGPAHYVVGTDMESNTVFVSADKMCPALWTREINLKDTAWIAMAAPDDGPCLARIRHTGKLMKAQLSCENYKNEAKLLFDKPASTPAPGQSVVIYRGKQCLGGGIAL